MPYRYVAAVAAGLIPFGIYGITYIAGGQMIALLLVAVIFGAIGYGLGYSLEE